MPHNTSRLEAVATIGIDIGKNTFGRPELFQRAVLAFAPLARAGRRRRW
jgi:hypothetical protein